MRSTSCWRILAGVLTSSLCLVMTGAGCNRSSEANSAAEVTPEVAELTKQVRRYSFEKHKLPQTVEDLVTAGYVKSIPPPPSGKKYSIDAKNATVILQNQ